jgi:hypothetical protein
MADTRVRWSPDVEMCDMIVSVSDDTTERPVHEAARPMGTTQTPREAGSVGMLSTQVRVMTEQEDVIGKQYTAG